MFKITSANLLKYYNWQILTWPHSLFKCWPCFSESKPHFLLPLVVSLMYRLVSGQFSMCSCMSMVTVNGTYDVLDPTLSPMSVCGKLLVTSTTANLICGHILDYFCQKLSRQTGPWHNTLHWTNCIWWCLTQPAPWHHIFTCLFKKPLDTRYYGLSSSQICRDDGSFNTSFTWYQ